MKKVFYSLCVVFVCTLVWVSCSDDDSISESRESVNKARLEAIIQKYGVNFVLNDSILSTEISDSDLADFEEVLKCLSDLKGRYKLLADSISDSTYFYKQLKQGHRNRRLVRSNETVTYGSWSFGEETEYDNYYAASYLCSCNLCWKKVNNVIEWAKVDPNINATPYSYFGSRFYITRTSNDYDISIMSDSTFRFDGTYQGDIIKKSDYGNYGYVEFGYEGEFSFDNSYIDWFFSDSFIDATLW